MGKAFKLDNEVLAASISSLNTTLTNHASTAATSSALGHVKTSTGITNSSGTISVSYGSAAGTACQGNDSRLSDSRTPTAHATSSTTYGGATASNYGHVKLSDKYTASDGAASASVGASSKAVYDCYTALNNNFNSGVTTIYNAFVNAGTTPTAKTPAALATAVTTLKNETEAAGTHCIVLSNQSVNASWNIKDICDNYASLTISNFYIGINTWMRIVHDGYQYWDVSINKSYNASTGIFSTGYTISGESGRTGSLGFTSGFNIQPVLIY